MNTTNERNGKIIILGSKKDRHVERVCLKLKKEKLDYLIIDYLAKSSYSFSSNNKGAWDIIINDEYRVSKKDVIWDRLKIIEGSTLYPEGDRREANLKANEWRAFYSLIKAFNSQKVINSLASRHFQLKPFQQIIASEVGLKIPKTIASNKKHDLLRFLETCAGSCITKTLSAAKVQPKKSEKNIPYNIMTMQINKKDVLEADEEQFSQCPLVLQEQVEKQSELRVFVVKDKVFPFLIDSQKYECSKVDWRYANLNLKFEQTEIPKKLELQLINYLIKQNMFSGSFDLILDKKSQYWFLECNQDGQWLWLDDLSEGVISTAIAKELAKLSRV